MAQPQYKNHFRVNPDTDLRPDIKHEVTLPSYYKQYQVTNVQSKSVKRFRFHVKSGNNSMLKDFRLKGTFRFKVHVYDEANSTNVAFFRRAIDFSASDYILNRMIKSVEVKFAGHSFKNELGKYINPITHTIPCRYGTKKYQIFPSYLQKYANLNDATLALNNPMNAYGNGVSDQLGNGCFDMVHVDKNGNALTPSGTYDASTTGTPINCNISADGFPITTLALARNYAVYLKYEGIEPLLVEPLNALFDCDRTSNTGLYSFGDMTVDIELNTDMASCLLSNSISNSSRVVSVELVDASDVQLTHTSYSQASPRLQSHICTKKFNSFIHNRKKYTTALAPGTEVELKRMELNLELLPKKFYIWVSVDPVELEKTDIEYNIPITKCAIQYGKRGGILANATQADLWEISRKNNLTLDYNSWVGAVHMRKTDQYNSLLGVGSILVIDVADLAFNELTCSGAPSEEIVLNLSVKNSVYNIHPVHGTQGVDLAARTVNNYWINVLAVNEEYLVIQNNKTQVKRHLVSDGELKKVVDSMLAKQQ